MKKVNITVTDEGKVIKEITKNVNPSNFTLYMDRTECVPKITSMFGESVKIDDSNWSQEYPDGYEPPYFIDRGKPKDKDKTYEVRGFRFQKNEEGKKMWNEELIDIHICDLYKVKYVMCGYIFDTFKECKEHETFNPQSYLIVTPDMAKDAAIETEEIFE